MSDSPENDEFANAQQAELLRHQIRTYAEAAVKYGHVDRDWINASLARIGVDPITGSAEYRLNVPITGVFGKTVHASSRAEALGIFRKAIEYTAQSGVIDGSYGGRVFEAQFSDTEPVFFSGPQDAPEPADADGMDLDTLKTAIRAMLKEGVTKYGWGIAYAVEALNVMGLPELPAQVSRTVEVPVTGTHRLHVTVFEDDDDTVVTEAAKSKIAQAGMVPVHADEVGEPTWERPSSEGSMGLHLVDGDDED